MNPAARRRAHIVASVGSTQETRLDALLERTGAALWIEHDHAHHESPRKSPAYYQ